MFAFSGRRTEEKKPSDIQGSPFTTEDWSLGNVIFRNGKMAKDVPLLFSTYRNMLLFKQGAEMFEFADPVKEFTIREKKNDQEVIALYRSGFPSINSNRVETFYQVLADGPYQLLDYRTKTVKKFRPTYSEPEVKQFEDKSYLYAFVPRGQIIKLNRADKDLVKALPEQEAAIQKIIADQKLRVSDREDLIKLFQALNEQTP